MTQHKIGQVGPTIKWRGVKNQCLNPILGGVKNRYFWRQLLPIESSPASSRPYFRQKGGSKIVCRSVSRWKGGSKIVLPTNLAPSTTTNTQVLRPWEHPFDTAYRSTPNAIPPSPQ